MSSSSSSTKMCNFCTKENPVLLIQLPVLGRKKRAATPYCLQCYYTTSAVRQDPDKYVSLLDKEEQMKQLPAIQYLFSECYLELQQELQQESARAFTIQQNSNKNDPLAAMLNFSSSSVSLSSSKNKRRRKSTVMKGPPPDREKKREGNANDGGFIRNIELPEDLKRTQQQQYKKQNQRLARMNQVTAGAATGAGSIDSKSNKYNISNSRSSNNILITNAGTKRRKGSGKSIWNLAMDKGSDGKLSAVGESYKTSDFNPNHNNINCTCGSNNVRNFGNITSRNQDVRKGEIWGTDRDEVINRYQCNECGRTWNEEE